jgi:transmembrane sensor
VYATGKGELAHVTLPDGSTVALSVDSRLEVPVNYSHGNRTIRLSGQALFSVDHRPQAPFSVVSGGVTAHVLGTSFVIRHYPDDTVTRVAVRDGKVEVRRLVLSAWQESDVTTHGITSARRVGSSPFTFATGVLTLNDITLRDAVIELSRWYNLDIRLGDTTLATRRIGGDFAQGASPDLIAMFEQTMQLRVVRNGRELILFPRSTQ